MTLRQFWFAMNSLQIKKIEKYFNIKLSSKTCEKLGKFEELFLEYNSHTNLMSKRDLGLLFEKHIFDSFSLFLFDEYKNYKKILDIGAGGGFPSLILAIVLPEINFIALDSVAKKTNFISLVKSELNLENLEVINSRAENLPPLNVDLIISRAVGRISYVFEVSKKHLAKNAKYIFWKADESLIQEELAEFKAKFKKNVLPKIIPYNLPTVEKHLRNLVIF